MSQLISITLLFSILILNTTSHAQLRPRRASKWDSLHTQSSCLITSSNPLFQLTNFTASTTVNATDGWISNRTGEPTVNPFFVDPATGQRRANEPFTGFAQLNGEGRCPNNLSYRWSRDISWTRASGEKVTVTIQRTHRCRDTQPNELFTTQRVFVRSEPRNSRNSNLSSREEDALIAEGVQALKTENERRLAATSLNYAAANITTTGAVYSADTELRNYISGCSGNTRSAEQERTAQRFCEARTQALRRIAGSNFSERDAQCPQLAPQTIAEVTAAGARPQGCGRTSIMPGRGEVSYCPIPASGVNVNVGDTADNGCRVDEITAHNIVVACPPGSIPRLPVGRVQTSPTSVQPTAAPAPASSAR